MPAFVRVEKRSLIGTSLGSDKAVNPLIFTKELALGSLTVNEDGRWKTTTEIEQKLIILVFITINIMGWMARL